PRIGVTTVILDEKPKNATDCRNNQVVTIRRRRMSLLNSRWGRAILAAATTITAIVFVWSGIRGLRSQPPSWPSTGSARLVSVERLPDTPDLCSSMPVSAIAMQSAEFDRDGFLGDSKVYAAETVDVSRPPVRTIRDTYPIYSSVAIDPVRD